MFAFLYAILLPSYCLDVVCNDRFACLQVFTVVQGIGFMCINVLLHIVVCLVILILYLPSLSKLFVMACDVEMHNEAHELMSQLCYTFLYRLLIQYC